MKLAFPFGSRLRLARVLGTARAISISVGVFALIIFVLLAAGFGSFQTVIVDAQTTGVIVTFKGMTNDWALGTSTLCIPKKIDLGTERGDGICDQRRFSERVSENLRISWPQGATVQVSSPDVGKLVLRLLSEGELPKDTRIVLSDGALSRLGALGFYGHARIGQPAVSGEQDLLLSGNYEIRERSFWSSNTEVLRGGELRRGESVEVFSDKGGGATQANQFGHLTAEAPDLLGFHVSIASEAGKPVLRVMNYGGVATTTLAPSWIDRLLHNSLILALALFLPLALSVAQFLGVGRTGE